MKQNDVCARSIHFLNILNEKKFLFSRFYLHKIDCFEFLRCAHLTTSRFFCALFVNLIYFWKNSTKIRTMIHLLKCIFYKRISLWIVNRLMIWNASFMFYFLIICYDIHVKLIHINFCWIETIIYRVILNEMFVCNFHSCLHVKFCQNILHRYYILQFVFAHILKYNEMFCFICNRRMFRNFFQLLFICWNFVDMFAMIYISQFAIVFACWNRVQYFNESFCSFVLFDQHMF